MIPRVVTGGFLGTLLLSVATCKGVIQRMEKARPHGCAVYLLSEIHERGQEDRDQEQFEQMCLALATHDARAPRPVQVLLEMPARIRGLFEETKKITRDLDADSCIKSLEHVRVENIEIRCVAGAAISLLLGGYFGELTYNSCERECNMGSMTLQDLFDEFEYYQRKLCQRKLCQRKLCQCKSVHSQEIDELFDVTLKSATNYRSMFETQMAPLVDGNWSTPICKLARTLEMQDQQAMVEFLHGMFSPLFELVMFDRILCNVQNQQDTVLVAGGQHIMRVRSLLAQAGMLQDHAMWREKELSMHTIFQPWGWQRFKPYVACAGLVGCAVAGMYAVKGYAPSTWVIE